VAALTNVAAAGTSGTDAPVSYTTGTCANEGHPAVVFDAVPGQTYHFAVGADSCCTPTSPNIVFRLFKSAPNDNFAEATPMAGDPHARVTGSNVFASREQFEPEDHGDASIWWRWTAPQTGPYTVHTCKTLPDADSRVGIYRGTAVNGLAAVPAEFAACARSSGSIARFDAVAGQTYSFVVGADSCCTPTSSGVVLVLRDRDCDAAGRKLAKAQKKLRKAKKKLKRAKKRAKENPTTRNLAKRAKAKRKTRSARKAVRKAREVQTARC
jgi:hypothetical protein